MTVKLLFYSVAFAMVGITNALALHAGSTPLTVVLLRNATMLVILVVYLRSSGVGMSLPPGRRWLALAIGVPLALNNYCITAAMGEIPVPLAVLIFYLWPAITTAGSWLIGTDRFRWPSLAGLVLAFVGVALALDVDFRSAQSTGVSYALSAAFTWSIVFLLMGHYFKGGDSRPVTLHMIGTTVAIFAVLEVLTGDFALPSGLAGQASLVAIGPLYAIGMIGIFTATQKLGPMRVGFFMNFEPVISVLLAALILGQTLTPVQLAGGALVILALFLFRPPAPRAAAAPSRGR